MFVNKSLNKSTDIDYLFYLPYGVIFMSFKTIFRYFIYKKLCL